MSTNTKCKSLRNTQVENETPDPAADCSNDAGFNQF